MSLIFFTAALAFSVASEASNEFKLYKITIRNHKFYPETLKVKANKKFRLEVKNEDDGFEEFEGRTLNIEKVVSPKKTLKLVLGPLKKGIHPFVGEFNPSTAKGQIIAE